MVQKNWAITDLAHIFQSNKKAEFRLSLSNQDMNNFKTKRIFPLKLDSSKHQRLFQTLFSALFCRHSKCPQFFSKMSSKSQSTVLKKYTSYLPIVGVDIRAECRSFRPIFRPSWGRRMSTISKFGEVSGDKGVAGHSGVFKWNRTNAPLRCIFFRLSSSRMVLGRDGVASSNFLAAALFAIVW